MYTTQHAPLQAIAECIHYVLTSDNDEVAPFALKNSLTPGETKNIKQLVEELEKRCDDSDSGKYLIWNGSTLASQSSISTKRAKDQVMTMKLTFPDTSLAMVIGGSDSGNIRVVLNSSDGSMTAFYLENTTDETHGTPSPENGHWTISDEVADTVSICNRSII